jgi:hypothetical protein
VNCSAKSFKCVSKAERIGLQIFIDVFFNQGIALKALRVRKDTQRGQAWAEPVHFIVCKSPMRHQRSYRSTATAMAERQRLTLIARSRGGGHSCNTRVRYLIVSHALGRLVKKQLMLAGP